MVTMLWAAGCFQAFLVVARFVLNLLNFIPAAICVYNTVPVENCTFKNKSYNILGHQELSHTINSIGTLLEDANSTFLIMLIFSWKTFNVRQFVYAIPRVGHFWVWCLFCVTNTLSILYVDIVHGKDHTGNISVQAVALISEMLLLTVLATAINFITNETYVDWVKIHFRGELSIQNVFKPLFVFALSAYFFRNLGLFLYDTALVSLSISLVKGGKVQGSRDWDSLLLLLSAAFRGSFTKFFFQKIFQGQQLPQVCENDEEEMSLSWYDKQRERLGGYRSIDASYEHSITHEYYGPH